MNLKWNHYDLKNLHNGFDHLVKASYETKENKMVKNNCVNCGEEIHGVLFKVFELMTEQIPDSVFRCEDCNTKEIKKMITNPVPYFEIKQAEVKDFETGVFVSSSNKTILDHPEA